MRKERASGTQAYRDFSAQMAAMGCCTVLMEGKDVFDMFEPRSDSVCSDQDR